MADKEFWNKRTEQYGHTGWSDPVIYAFDQLVRKQVVREVLDTLLLRERDAALDFGCGSGEFSHVLSSRFQRVIGFDISDRVLKIARTKHARPNIEFCRGEAIEYLDIPDSYLDVVLSVTVLGHVVQASEVSKTLSFLHAKMKADGYFVALEFIDTSGLRDNEYQSFRSFSCWKALFGQCGFQLEHDYGVFYPPAGSPAYRHYLDDILISVYRSCGGSRFVGAPVFLQKQFERIASKYLMASSARLYWKGEEADSMKMMIFGKIAAPTRALSENHT